MVADAVTRVHSMTSKQGHFATSDRFDRPERSQSFEKFIFWNAVNPTDPLPRNTTFDANRWKDPRTVFYRIHEIHSFIWRWYWKKLAISSHFSTPFLRKNALCPADFRHLKNSRQKIWSYRHNFVSQFLTKNLCILDLFFLGNFALLRIMNYYYQTNILSFWRLNVSFYWKPMGFFIVGFF